MLVNHAHKIAFIHIPKTAGTSIRKWMTGNLECEEFGYPHDNLRQHQDRLTSDYRVFAVVRNPYDRLISHIRFHLQGGSHRQSWRTLRRLADGGKMANIECIRMYLEMPDVNIGSVNYERKFWYDYRFTPQHEWVANDKFEVRVFKQEELHSQFAPWIKEVTGLDMELPRENVTKLKCLAQHHKLWKQDIIDRVNPVFKIDCDAYGYQFKDQSTSS